MAARARQLESTSGEPRDEVGFPWSKLPRELQHKVLSCLALAALFQARSVCRDWRAVVHRHEFATLYDEVHRSAPPPAPAICYTTDQLGHVVEWARYDYAAAAWKRMTRLANPGEDCSVYAVGGLLCFHCKSKTWVVWNPLTGRRKTLPPYRSRGGAATAFVCAFEAGAAERTYKILMAHYQVPRHKQRREQPGSLVTQVYDSATGTWTPEHTRQLRMIPFLSTRGGVVGRNGVAYFRSSRNSPGVGVERVLLCYDIRSGQWREEASDRRCTRLFEWDGRVRTVMLQEEEVDASKFVIFEWDPGSRKWGDTGLEIPMKVKRKFDYSVSMSTALLEMVAARELLVVAGYARDGSFTTAVYNDAEKNWRCQVAPAFARSATCRLNGMVQFQPRLDWVP